MNQQIVSIKCPGCGSPVALGQKECDYCHGPIIISSFSSMNSMTPPQLHKYAKGYREALAEHPENKELNGSIAMCYMKLGLYDMALPAFKKAIEDNFDNSETYFYTAVCLLKGKKAFVQMRPVINEIEEYLNAAIMVEPRGIYYYFLAYIKYDYFNRKCFKTSPTYQEALANAAACGVTEYDIAQLFEMLKVDKPDKF